MAPGVRNVTALNYDVIDRSFAETAACGQTSMSSADDDCRDMFDEESPTLSYWVTRISVRDADRSYETRIAATKRGSRGSPLDLRDADHADLFGIHGTQIARISLSFTGRGSRESLLVNPEGDPRDPRPVTRKEIREIRVP
jgi:hypothetical protein